MMAGGEQEQICVRLDVMEGDIELLKEDVKELKEDVKGLKEDVKGLKEDVKGLKEDVKGLKEDVTELKADMRFVKTGLMRMEVEQGRKLDALFDMMELLADAKDEGRRRTDRLETVSEGHEIRITCLEAKAAL